MSFSDFLLAIFVLSGAALIVWIFDLNPYTTKLHVYTQTCDNMILDNSFCKGSWIDNPISVYQVDRDSEKITLTYDDHSQIQTFSDCSIKDRKNWTCIDQHNSNEIIVKDGKVLEIEGSDTRQITRLEWLQNKLLEKVS